ncbi:MAG TPA: hypothetical protein VFQ53_01845 [Kofleriaceae bacterium]|nr:hypothetical protein [Kofleriaceae bacterium]
MLALLVACGSGPRPDHDPDAGSSAPHDGPTDGVTEPSDGATATDARASDAMPTPDAFPAVLDVRIQCRNDCVLVASPPSISVPAGTGFQVNWINVGDTECDVAKIDPFNQVPIVLGLEPGTSYFDSVRTWCGPLFTGTFDFRISICTIPSFIPVDCGA